MPPKNKGKADGSKKGSAATDNKGNKGNKGKGNSKGEGESSKEEKLKPTQKLQVRHILCEKESKIKEAVAKLEEGVSFDAVAREFSEDKAKDGGSLGVIDKTKYLASFFEVAYALPESTTAKPKYSVVRLKDTSAWHIIMVEKRV